MFSLNYGEERHCKEREILLKQSPHCPTTNSGQGQRARSVAVLNTTFFPVAAVSAVSSGRSGEGEKDGVGPPKAEPDYLFIPHLGFFQRYGFQ